CRRWAAGFDPQVLKEAILDGSSGRDEYSSSGDGRDVTGGREGEDIADHLGWDRLRKDDDAERPLELHSPRGEADHHRGRRRTAASASACRADGDQAAER